MSDNESGELEIRTGHRRCPGISGDTTDRAGVVADGVVSRTIAWCGAAAAVSVQLQITPVAHSNQPATGSYDQSGSDQSTRASNFRLDITGLSLGTVSDVTAITFRPSSHDCPGPTLHVPAAQASNVQQWMQRILVAGNAQGASSTTTLLTVYDSTKNTRAFAIEWQRSTPMDLVFDGGSQSSQVKLRLACAVLRVTP